MTIRDKILPLPLFGIICHINISKDVKNDRAWSLPFYGNIRH